MQLNSKEQFEQIEALTDFLNTLEKRRNYWIREKSNYFNKSHFYNLLYTREQKKVRVAILDRKIIRLKKFYLYYANKLTIITQDILNLYSNS